MPVYMIQAGGKHGPVKIGVTDDVEKRLFGMQTGNHLTLAVMRLFEGGPAEERALHQRFDDLRLNGEWFSFSKAMLGDLGLVELSSLIGKELKIYNRMERLSARHLELGDELWMAELTPEDSAFLRWGMQRLTMPVWEYFGFPNPRDPRRRTNGEA